MQICVVLLLVTHLFIYYRSPNLHDSFRGQNHNMQHTPSVVTNLGEVNQPHSQQDNDTSSDSPY